MPDLIEEPRGAEMLASVIAGSATVRSIGVLRPVMCRFPEVYLAKVDAMAKMAGKSRSAMVVHLVSVALEEVELAATSDTRKRLNEEADALLSLMQQDGADRQGGAN